MHIGLIGGVSAAVLMGLGIGWVAAGPRDSSPAAHSAKLPAVASAPANLPGTPVQGEDTWPGWQDRDDLRARLTSTISRFEHHPCDEGARQDFIDTWVERGHALMDSGSTPDGRSQPYWSTKRDGVIDTSIDRLQREDLVT